MHFRFLSAAALAFWPSGIGSLSPSRRRRIALTMDLPNDAATLDPHLQWDTTAIASIAISSTISSPVTPRVRSCRRSRRPGNISTIKPSNFRIRDDVTFQDGSKLTADDVAYSINRIIDPALKSPQLSQFNQIDKAEATSPTVVEDDDEVALSSLACPARQAFHRAEGLCREGWRSGIQSKAYGQRPLQARAMAEGRADRVAGQRPLLACKAAIRTCLLSCRARRVDPSRRPEDRQGGPRSRSSLRSGD